MGKAGRIIKRLEEWKEAAYSRWMDCGGDTPSSIQLKYHTQYLERERCLGIAKECLKECPEEDGWIPCAERLPKPEEEIEISIKRVRYGEKYYFSIRGFFEDGNVWNEDSSYLWDFPDDAVEWDDKGKDFRIPESWWECSYYADEEDIYAIEDTVLAWRPLPEPYREPETKRGTTGRDGKC